MIFFPSKTNASTPKKKKIKIKSSKCHQSHLSKHWWCMDEKLWSVSMTTGDSSRVTAQLVHIFPHLNHPSGWQLWLDMTPSLGISMCCRGGPKKKKKKKSFRSSRCGSVETNLTTTHEDASLIPAWLSGLRIWRCREL